MDSFTNQAYTGTMFIGHFSLALAAKKVAPKTSLGTLILSVVFVDAIWPIFLFLGWEHARIVPGITAMVPMDLYDYPISHSLIGGAGWALLFGGVYYALTRYSRGAWVLAAGVLSHWFLDFVTHRPDMPIGFAADAPKYGLGLWNSIPATMAVEIPMFCLGIWIYLKATRAKDAIGKWALVGFLGLLVVIYFASVFGPPPPNESALATFGLFTLPLYAWPYWIDRHRK
ncbi:MAG: hypothetical protein JNL01_08705 [Bdellovibrionales bacterium]|nr:hypothetical protein [Bdellovibrionales bacterium]